MTTAGGAAAIAEPVTVLVADLYSARDAITVTVADAPEDNPVTVTNSADRTTEPDVVEIVYVYRFE
jgi:hypothetical protein